MASADKRRIPYLPAVDGLRGLAVAAVIAYHAGMPWARGGFLGVDAFFVISGFLITSLLFAEHDATGSLDLRAFWLRRARRLLPALVLVLLGVAVYAAWFADPRELREIRSDSFATLTYLANWKPILQGDSYFDQFAVPSPLMHTWSLAIEEQWYLVWPLVVLVAMKFRPAVSTLLGVTFALALLSAAWMAFLYEPGGDPSRVYYGTDTRAQSLLLGAFLALGVRQIDGRVGTVRPLHASLVGAGALAGLVTSWALVDYDTAFLYRGGFLLLAITTTTLIAAITIFPRSLLAQLLGSAPLRSIGLISYGIYLWHWPIFIVLTPDRLGIDGYALFFIRIAATVAIAAISYHLVEQPIRRGALTRLPRHTWVLGPAGAAAIVALTLIVTRAPESADDAFAQLQTEAPPLASAPSGDIRLLVVGDSVAYTAGQGFGRVGKNYHLSVWNQGRLGCGVLRGDRVLVDGRWTDVSPDCSDWPERWKSYIDLYDPEAVLVLAGAWDVQDREVDGTVLEFGSPPADEFARRELGRAVDVLSSGGAHVFLLTTPHYKQQDLGLVSSSPRFDADRIARLNAIYGDVAASNPAAEVVDLASFLTEPTADDTRRSDDITSDGVHFTDAGADLVATWLSPQIAATVTPRNREAIATTVRAPASPAHWLELLAAIPDTQATRRAVALNDYTRFREIFGLPSPDSSDREAMLQDRSRLVFDPTGGRTGLSPAPSSRILEATSPPREVVEQDAWSTDNEVQLVWTEDASDLNCGSACESLGSLADVAEFRLLVEGIKSSDAYAMLVSQDPESFEAVPIARVVAGPDATPADIGATEERLRAEPMLEPFLALATATSQDESGAVLTIELLHSDPEAAALNAELLARRIAESESWLTGTRFSEMLEVLDTQTQGNLLVVRLRTESAAYWFGLVAAHDTLLLHR